VSGPPRTSPPGGVPGGLVPALAALATLGALAPHPAHAGRGADAAPAAHVEHAAACQRRGDWACALAESDAALAGLRADDEHAQTDEPRASATASDAARRLERRALIARAEALARLGRAAEAARAYRRVIRSWPGWSPPPDAPPSVRRAFREGRLEDLRARLPERLPLPPAPSPGAAPAEVLAPPPILYAPKHLVDLDPQAARVQRWRLAMGGGAALLAGRAREMFAHGAAASLELGVMVSPRWRVLVGADLSLHNFAESFRPEPGYGRGLTTTAFTVGIMADLPVLRRLDAFGAVAAGGGMFGVRSIAERSGVALRAMGGARYWLTPALGIRVEAGIQATFPLGGAAGELPKAAAHGTLGLRLEARF